MVTRSRHLLSRRVLPSLVSPVIAGTFSFAWKLTRISSLEFKEIFSKFYLQFGSKIFFVGQARGLVLKLGQRLNPRKGFVLPPPLFLVKKCT